MRLLNQLCLLNFEQRRSTYLSLSRSYGSFLGRRLGDHRLECIMDAYGRLGRDNTWLWDDARRQASGGILEEKLKTKTQKIPENLP